MNVQSNPEKSAATRLAAKQFARLHLKQSFTDTAHWRELAAAAGIRLPLWYLPATSRGVRRYSEGMGLSLEQIADATGCKSFRTFAEMNPNWPLWGVVGLLLELKHSLSARSHDHPSPVTRNPKHRLHLIKEKYPMAKSSLSYQERTRIEFLTSHLRSSSRLAVKAKYETELAQILEGKELTRGDMALAAYYFQNSGTDVDSIATSQSFAQAYRDAPAE